MLSINNSIDRPPCPYLDGRCKCGAVTQPVFINWPDVKSKIYGWHKAPDLCEACKRAEDHRRVIQDAKNDFLRGLDLSPRQMDMSFENYIEPPREIINYAGDRNLIIHGPVGTGKTHLAIAIAKRLIDTKIKAVKFITAVNMLYDIRRCYSDQSGLSAENFIQRYSEFSYLVIDDLGAEKPSEWVRETFYLVIDNRYNDLLPTIITSNLSPYQLAAKLDDRMISRLLTDALIVKVDGGDYRLKNKKRSNA